MTSIESVTLEVSDPPDGFEWEAAGRRTPFATAAYAMPQAT
jgi:hypothetical protein